MWVWKKTIVLKQFFYNISRPQKTFKFQILFIMLKIRYLNFQKSYNTLSAFFYIKRNWNAAPATWKTWNSRGIWKPQLIQGKLREFECYSGNALALRSTKYGLRNMPLNSLLHFFHFWNVIFSFISAHSRSVQKLRVTGDNRILSLKQERFIAYGSHDGIIQLLVFNCGTEVHINRKTKS